MATALLATAATDAALAAPYTPASSAIILAELAPGAQYTSSSIRQLAQARPDVALPLAQFYISRARSSGDQRYLGYAEGMLTPWLGPTSTLPGALVLHATILQSRHAFTAALAELDQALKLKPNDAQAWLTRATVLRVLGRLDEAMLSCQRLAALADAAITTLCVQSLRGLSGHLESAYAAVASLPQQTLAREAQAWRCSELGEMAERMGQDAAAEHWLRRGLQLAPDDLYLRAAYADLLLRQRRAPQVLQLLAGYESQEPMLLRVALAQQLARGAVDPAVRGLLVGAFDLEALRGEGMHRREQGRLLLDIDARAQAALAVAQQNWRVQREPDDALLLLRAAQAANRPDAAAPVLQFLQQHHLEDVRLDPYRSRVRT